MKYILKSCPFCGGEAELRTNSQVTYCWVECAECESRTRRFVKDIEYCAMDSAVKVWNLREKMDEEVDNE